LGFLSRLTPHAHALQGYRLILSDTGDSADIMLQVAILLVMAVVMFAIATWRLKFDQ
jgi:ABC-type multidrug transport system permease subunit